MLNILVCFGTRPEAIKLAPVCDELKNKGIAYKVCLTGQHKEMLHQVLDFFHIQPHYNLELMRPNQTLNGLSSRVLEGVDNILNNNDFNLVIVHGDTTTSVMTALAAYHRGIKVAHIEAGLRTHNKLSPFPEEINRQITGRIADLHFSPTKDSKTNLLNEGVKSENIYITGNTVIDALLTAKSKIRNNYSNKEILKLTQVLNIKKNLILVTGHRRENFGDGMIELCNALKKLAKNKDLEIVFPVHLNPNVDNVVRGQLKGIKNIHLISPVEYPTFIWLMDRAKLVISDSGGVQEEAPAFNVPVIVTRDISERMEGVELGCSYLVGANSNKIISKTNELLEVSKSKEMLNPYGDGKASVQIVDILLKYAN